MIDQIKTALADGACESVTVKLSDIDEVYSVFNEQSELIWLTNISEPIESFTVNLRKFGDFNVGDLVSTRNGDGVIIESGLDYKVNMQGSPTKHTYRTYQRHELALLQKGE